MKNNNKTKLSAYLLFLLPTIFFGFQFILRIWPGLQIDNIMERFTLDATSFGLLSSMYYFGYSGSQIPIAALLEKYGPRIVVFVCALLCGSATLLFTYTENWILALISRFLVGVGSGVGFLGVSKVISMVFPKEKYTRMVGISFSLGLMGAVYGGKPVNLLIESFGWQTVASCIAYVSIAISILILCFLIMPKSKNTLSSDEIVNLTNFKELLKSPIIWKLAIANLFMVGTFEGLADVWGVNFFMKAYSLTRSDSAQLLSFVFIGMLFGGPILAFLSEKFGERIVICISGIGMSLILFVLIFSVHHISYVFLASSLFVVGVFCCYQVIVFSAGSKIVEAGLLGVTIAFLNSINMLGGSFFHTMVGGLMDFLWDGKMEGTLRIYSINCYQYSLVAIPAFTLVGCLMVYNLKNKIK